VTAAGRKRPVAWIELEWRVLTQSSEYEAYDILMSLASQTYQLMFGFFSLVFAFIVMSHMAARKISGQLVWVVIALYSVAMLVVILNFYAINTDLDNLYLYMMAQKQSGAYDLSWFGANPPILPKSLTILQVLLGIGGYFGSVFFFFHSRAKTSST
jgi:hypothetical protein